MPSSIGFIVIGATAVALASTARQHEAAPFQQLPAKLIGGTVKDELLALILDRCQIEIVVVHRLLWIIPILEVDLHGKNKSSVTGLFNQIWWLFED